MVIVMVEKKQQRAKLATLVSQVYRWGDGYCSTCSRGFSVSTRALVSGDTRQQEYPRFFYGNVVSFFWRGCGGVFWERDYGSIRHTTYYTRYVCECIYVCVCLSGAVSWDPRPFKNLYRTPLCYCLAKSVRYPCCVMDMIPVQPQWHVRFGQMRFSTILEAPEFAYSLIRCLKHPRSPTV